jgi:eukaryotic-like serine/threonine-protein kinase
MTHFNGTISGFPRWAPDGKSLVFHVRQKTVAVLYTLDLEGETIRPLLGNPGNDFAPSWSHDGKWVYFSSRRTGDKQIWRARRNGGWPEQMTRHGGNAALASPDGQYVYYSKPNGLWRQSIGGGEEAKVFTANIAANGSAYALGRSGIYYIGYTGEASGLGLYVFDLKTGQMKCLMDIPAPIELGLALSPDERSILYGQLDHVESDLMLVENFR